MPQKHYMPTIYIHLKETLTHVLLVSALIARGLPRTLFTIFTQQLAPTSIFNDVP